MTDRGTRVTNPALKARDAVDELARRNAFLLEERQSLLSVLKVLRGELTDIGRDPNLTVDIVLRRVGEALNAADKRQKDEPWAR